MDVESSDRLPETPNNPANPEDPEEQPVVPEQQGSHEESFREPEVKEEPNNPMNPEDPDEQPVAPEQEGSQEDSFREPEVKEETPPLRTPIERDPTYLLTLKFENTPLGMVLTSAPNGQSAYVTEVKEEKNDAYKNDKLPLKSKLLKVNGKDIELDSIDDITHAIIEGIRSLPLELTFCHPDGLNEDEEPDPFPRQAN